MSFGGQGKCHIRPARWRAKLASAGGDDHILAPPDFVCCRRGVSCGWKSRLPEQFPREFVESAKFFVVIRRPNEKQSAGCDDRAAIILAAGVAQTFFGECRELAE